MKRSGIFGILLLIAALILFLLMVIRVPKIVGNDFDVASPVMVYGSGEMNNFYNLTVDPKGKEDYRVEVELSPYDSSIHVDFWAVNKTGLGVLGAFLDYGQLFQNDYPDGNQSFGKIETYAKVIDVTVARRFDLNLTGENPYCLILLNFYEDSQNISVRVRETYVESYNTLVEGNYVNAVLSVGIVVVAAVLIFRSRRRAVRKIRRLDQSHSRSSSR